MAVQDLSDNGTIDPSQIPGECLNTTPHMETIIVSTNGIAKLLKDLNPHKAAGPDQIKPLVLQKLCDVIAPILQVIFQRSLNTGRVSKDLSTAFVCPLFKKGDTSLASNYRPISLTSILCKMLEHVVTTNIVSHMDKYYLLYDLQHGFHSKRSCETQLVNHKRHFIKIPFINKGIEFIDLHSIFKDNSVISSIPNYFNNSETPIICYKYNKPIRSTIFNFNKIVNDLDIDSNTPAS